MFIDQFFAWLQAVDAWIEGLMWLLISWVHALGPLGVFIGVMIETFIAPIPSPLVPMAAGAILTIGLDPVQAILVILFSVMFVGALAATIGSFFAYGIAYFGGYPIIERYGKYLGTSIEEIEYTRQSLEKSSRDEIYLFTARAIPIVPLSVVSLLYGALRADPKRYTLFTFLGCLPRYLVLGITGWLLGLVLLNIIDWYFLSFFFPFFGFQSLVKPIKSHTTKFCSWNSNFFTFDYTRTRTCFFTTEEKSRVFFNVFYRFGNGYITFF